MCPNNRERMGGWVGLWYGWMGGFVVWVDGWVANVDNVFGSIYCLQGGCIGFVTEMVT